MEYQNSGPSGTLKETTRNKRGKGSDKKVAANVKMPRKWKAFLTAEIRSKLVIITSGKYHNIIMIKTFPNLKISKYYNHESSPQLASISSEARLHYF